MKKLLFITMLFSTVYAQKYRSAFLYTFKDASVAPEHQRNYMIEVGDSSIHFIVDNYEDVLLDEVYQVSLIRYIWFERKLKACHLKDKEFDDVPKECTGGTSDSFFFLWNGTTPWDGYMNQCGGKEYGNLKGKLNEARALFKSMVPDFDIKLASTRN